MDINRIRYFLSFAKTGNQTRAAELHRISAPAFSKALKVFEQELGITLITPSGRGVLLTDAAKALIPQFEDIVRRIDAVKGQKSPVADSSPLVRIASFEVFTTYFMEHCLTKELKGYRCELHEFTPGHIEEAVALGRVDMAITYLPIPYAGLDFLKIAAVPMGVFGRQVLTESELASAPFAVPTTPVEGSPNKVKGLDGWPEDTRPRNIVYRITMLESALGLARRGAAVVYIPKFIAHLHNESVKEKFQLKETPLPRGFKSSPLSVYLIKRKSDAEGTAIKKVAAALRVVLRDSL